MQVRDLEAVEVFIYPSPAFKKVLGRAIFRLILTDIGQFHSKRAKSKTYTV